MWYARELLETGVCVWKGVWGLRGGRAGGGEAWGLGLKGSTGICLLVPNVTSSEISKLFSFLRILRNTKKHWSGSKFQEKM